MIDYFSIGLTHGLMLVALWRLLMRGDLDAENPEAAKPARPWLKADQAAAGADNDAERPADA